MTGTVYVLAVIGAITTLNFAFALVLIADVALAARRRSKRRMQQLDAELSAELARVLGDQQ